MLDVKQGPKNVNAADIKSQVLEAYLTRNLDSLRSKDDQISYLKKEILNMQGRVLPMDKISKEAALFDEKINKLCILEAVYFDKEGKSIDTLHLALTEYNKKPKNEQVERFQKWLKARIESDSVRVLVE